MRLLTFLTYYSDTIYNTSMMNTEDEFEALYKKWPDLLHKSRHQGYMGVGKGWHNIIDVLCGLMSAEVEQVRARIKYSRDNPTAQMKQSVEEMEDELEKLIDELPVILDIKEKFGGLRFYVDHAPERIRNYIDFAEQLSNYTCEVCGQPGKHRGGGWIKTLCDFHGKARERGEDIWKDYRDTE